MAAISSQLNFFDSELPVSVRLRSGVKFQPDQEHWKFVDGIYTVYMNFSDLPTQVAPLVPYIKQVLINFLEINAPTYAVNMYRSFIRLADVIALTELGEVRQVTETHVLNFIAAHKRRPGIDGHLSALISRWSETGIPGLSKGAIKLLKSIRKKSNKKGHAVLTQDPVEGPFTEFEIQQLTQALNLAYADGRIEPKFYYLTWLALLTGQRVSQYCALKVRDLTLKSNSDGSLAYEILIPKAKQRGAILRDEFLVRPLLRQFGEEFFAYAQEVQAEYPELGPDAPMFPTNVDSNVLQLDEAYQEHWSPGALSVHFTKALSEIAPISPRTSEPMHMVIGRFRDTLGTRAAQEGFGELVIAEILGHVDTQNVKCYVAVIPEIAERLDKSLAKDLAPIANAFVGTILIMRSGATRFGDSSSEIIDYKNSGQGVGNCGTNYNCKFNAPVACYTCPKFEAWIDAPHAELYQQLERERNEILEVSGQRLAAINDLTMIAIKNVVDECARLKEELKGIAGG
jgi:integrase